MFLLIKYPDILVVFPVKVLHTPTQDIKQLESVAFTLQFLPWLLAFFLYIRIHYYYGEFGEKDETYRTNI